MTDRLTGSRAVAVPVPLTADPTHWRHAEECPWLWTAVCSCGLSAVRDAIAAGHRVVIGPDGALADPAPVGLTEDEIDAEVTARLSDTERMGWVVAEKLAEENLRLSAAPVDDRERLAELEDWLLGAEHHGGCSGEYKKDDGTWAYRCKCGLRELRDERPVSPSVDPEDASDV